MVQALWMISCGVLRRQITWAYTVEVTECEDQQQGYSVAQIQRYRRQTFPLKGQLSQFYLSPLKLKSNRKGRRANQQEAFFKYLWVMLSPSRQFPRLLCCNNNKLIFHFLSLVIIMTSLRVSEPPPQGLAGSGGELPPSSLQTERYEESSPLHFDPLFQALKNVYSVVLHP